MKKLPLLAEVTLDQQQNGLEADLIIDRAAAARLGLTVTQIDNTLYAAERDHDDRFRPRGRAPKGLDLA